MTSDAGAVLRRETDRRLDLLPRLAACFEDRRQPWLISHTVRELVAQRVYALAGKSTLNRLELGGEQPTRYKKIHYSEAAIDELLTKVFLEAHTEAPEQIVRDLDTTGLALHGHQEGRFFHGYYDSYCYLPRGGTSQHAMATITTITDRPDGGRTFPSRRSLPDDAGVRRCEPLTAHAFASCERLAQTFSNALTYCSISSGASS